ncbi:MAG: BspA family leucine-rich repeat surface protein, partial [Promicromonosporaceae bacterium]|nr:BspA family leucine-rich repeat surface protein [Promicromonosporaceae bacterium]
RYGHISDSCPDDFAEVTLNTRKIRTGAAVVALVAALLAVPAAQADIFDNGQGEAPAVEAVEYPFLEGADALPDEGETAVYDYEYDFDEEATVYDEEAIVSSDTHDREQVAPQATSAIVPASLASGQFPNVGGNPGALWELHPDGTVVVDSGVVTVPPQGSPFAEHAALITSIEFIGPVIAGPLLTQLFAGLTNVTAIHGLEYFDTSNVTNMNGLFSQTSSLTTLSDVSGWDTGNVTNMTRMFYRATSLPTVAVGGWNTGAVTNTSFMFFGATALTTVDVSNWDTGSVVNMAQMFNGATALTTLDVSGWDTGNVANLTATFEGTSSLTALDVSNWDTSSAVLMHATFRGASALTELDVSGWDTSSATHMQSMFAGVSGVRALDLSNWDTSSVVNMSLMFNLMTGLRELTLGEGFINATGTNPLNPSLPNVHYNETYTGRWIRVGTGTLDCPHGPDTPTSAELMVMMVEEAGEVLADTWVWQQREPGCLFQLALYGPALTRPDYLVGEHAPGYLDSVTESAAPGWTYLADVFTLLDVPGPTTAPPPGVVWQPAAPGAPYAYFAYAYFTVRDTALDSAGTVFTEEFTVFPLRFTRTVPTPTPTPEPTVEPTLEPSAPPTLSPSPSPEAHRPDGPGLPVTGAGLAGIGVAAALLIGGLVSLLSRRTTKE